jgi:hydroxyacylglutathione hydrolase
MDRVRPGADRDWERLQAGLGALLAFALLVAWFSPDLADTGPVPGIAVTGAQALARRPDTLVLDVRSRRAYGEGHLPHAIAVPLDDLGARLADFAGARTHPVLVYCGDGSTLGPRATRLLRAEGFVQAANLEGGYPAWRRAGLPVER